MFKKSLLLTALYALVAISQASASVVVYTDLASFTAAAGNIATETFTGGAFNTGLTAVTDAGSVSPQEYWTDRIVEGGENYNLFVRRRRKLCIRRGLRSWSWRTWAGHSNHAKPNRWRRIFGPKRGAETAPQGSSSGWFRRKASALFFSMGGPRAEVQKRLTLTMWRSAPQSQLRLL